MLVIRLARTGRKKYPTYRLVAAESSRAATGKFVAILGHYNPHTKEFVLKKEETLQYLGHGAQPSNTVVKLLQREKVDLPAWVAVKTKNRPPKKAEEPKAAAPAEAADKSTEEAPEEPRVAETAADEDLAVAEDNAEGKDPEYPDAQIETAASEEARAEAAEEGEAAAAEAAEGEEA